MQKKISVTEVPNSSKDSADNNSEFFKLEYGALHFGYLYLTQETYSLIWDGTLDFKYLNETAHFFLHKQIEYLKLSRSSILENQKSEFNPGPCEYVVSLIYLDKLIQFRFNNSEGLSEREDEFKGLLEEADNISFVRYDFQLESLPFHCSFTADNSPNTLGKGREMTFSLPRSQPITKSLLRWVFSYHVSFRELKLHADYHYSPHIIGNIISTGVT